MKRKFFALILMALFALCAVCFIGCNDSASNDEPTVVDTGDASPTVGLKYELSEDQTYYICSGLGTAVDSDIIIADTHKDLPVKEIKKAAFKGSQYIESVIIPEGITTIGIGAFESCSDLKSIIFPSTVTSIGADVLNACSSLEKISVASGNATYHSAGNCFIKTESKTLFVGCKASQIPDDGSVTAIGGSAFFKHTKLTSITIPNTVTSIGSYAFQACGMNAITIPSSVKRISDNAFSGCFTLEEVIFEDTNNWSYNQGIPLDVTDSAKNAENLRNTYKEYIWSKK